jgi:hypothetical protein
MNKRRDDTKTKSNYLRRRRVARAARNGERRPAPPRPRRV